jgi:hypothetical protein
MNANRKEIVPEGAPDPGKPTRSAWTQTQVVTSKNVLYGVAIAVVLQLGMLAGSAQTNKYLFSGSKTNITLNPGIYIITAYGAPGSGGGKVGL